MAEQCWYLIRSFMKEQDILERLYWFYDFCNHFRFLVNSVVLRAYLLESLYQ